MAEGDSMRYWSRLLDGPDALLHGFDSFEGLPSTWALGWAAGSFSTQGSPPVFDDPRVTLFIGRFADTLPIYEWPEG